MRLLQLALVVTILIIAGCGGSRTNSNSNESRPYAFVKPAIDETSIDTDKGGNEGSITEEEEFKPHPLIPLESPVNKNLRKDDPLLNGGFLYDLGLEIEPIGGSTNNIVVDPMLESIRQDLMIKWGMDERGTSTQKIMSSAVPDIHLRISNLENSMKGDLAALRSENLLLLSKLQELEKRIVSKPKVKKKTSKKAVSRKIIKPIVKTASKTIKPKIKKSYKVRYDNALSDYRKRRFASAIKKFNALLAENNNNNLSDNAQYWIGECYYHMKLYSKAATGFGNVLNYKNSNKIDSAILMRGKAYKHLGRKSDAIAQFRTLVTNYPRSSYTKRARELISDLERI
ncbi:MAG: tetratricopeptide repeat protein [Candidatus Marinimicrobia bacterium]|nr:tetratricopeptide repeat protein [Candidatus Neomarinimicrobiota bacterium]